MKNQNSHEWKIGIRFFSNLTHNVCLKTKISFNENLFGIEKTNEQPPHILATIFIALNYSRQGEAPSHLRFSFRSHRSSTRDEDDVTVNDACWLSRNCGSISGSGMSSVVDPIALLLWIIIVPVMTKSYKRKKKHIESFRFRQRTLFIYWRMFVFLFY